MRPVIIVDETREFSRSRFEAAMVELSLPGGGRAQHGTSMHYPDCPGARCSGCLPPVLEGEIVGPDTGPLHGYIPGRVDRWVRDEVWGVARYDPDEQVVFGVDVGGGEDRAVAFARIRDGVIGVVHVPDIR